MSDLVPDDRALLDRARGGLEPSLEDRARVRGTLAAQLGIGVALAATTATGAAGAAGATAGGAATTTAGAAALGSSGLALKVLASVVLIGAIGAGAAIYGTRSSSAPVPPKASVALTAPAVAPFASPAVSAEATAAAEDLVAPSAAQAVAASSTPASTAGSIRGRTTPTTKTESSKVDPSAEGALTVETRLIGDANAALRGGDATRALALLDEHARRFPGGVLAEERDAERVLALCAAGRTADARARTERFLRERPGSALAPKVRGSCGGQ